MKKGALVGALAGIIIPAVAIMMAAGLVVAVIALPMAIIGGVVGVVLWPIFSVIGKLRG